MLQNDFLVAKIDFDTAENDPWKICENRWILAKLVSHPVLVVGCLAERSTQRCLVASACFAIKCKVRPSAIPRLPKNASLRGTSTIESARFFRLESAKCVLPVTTCIQWELEMFMKRRLESYLKCIEFLTVEVPFYLLTCAEMFRRNCLSIWNEVFGQVVFFKNARMRFFFSGQRSS